MTKSMEDYMMEIDDGKRLSNLIARLEAAEGPSRKLDVEIKCCLEPHWDDPQRRLMMLNDEGVVQCPHYTESIDAALSFTPEGMVLQSLLRRTQPEMGGRMWSATIHGYKLFRSNGQRTPALAICIANLRALEAQEEA